MMKPAYLSTLTPLRGVAAVLVLLFHSHIFIYPLVDPSVTLLLQKGWLWVDFFFVLSGFILFHVYGPVFRDGVKGVAYRHYLRARFARVYPLHFFTLLWAFAAGTLVLAGPIAEPFWNRFFHFIFGWDTVPASLLLLQAMHLFPTAPLNTVSWSLSTEWWMYMLFPLLVPWLAASGRVRRWVWLLGVAGGYAAVKYWLVPRFGMHLWQRQPASINTINDFAFVRCAAGFVLGMLSCRWYQVGVASAWLRRDGVFVGIVGALLLSLHFDGNELITVALFPFLILATVYNASGVNRLLGAGPAQRLGDWSFSIYMVHIPLFFSYRGMAGILGWPLPQGAFTQHPDYGTGWLCCTVFLGVTLVVASITYRLVEVPARNYLNGIRPLRVRDDYESCV